MARRTLSMQGRIVAAGLSVAVGGALVAFMAAGDHTADASSPSSSSAVSPDERGAAATPADGRGSDDDGGGFDGFPSGNDRFQPQPQTRTGGS